MQNPKPNKIAPVACAFLLSTAAWGQSGTPGTTTVADLLKQQQAGLAGLSAPAQPKIERVRATVTLDAIYGAEQQLRFDLSLNGQQRHALVEGDVLKAGSASCRIHRYDPQKRCIGLSQVAASMDVCPRQACWSGEPPPAAIAMTTSLSAMPGTRSAQVITIPPVMVPPPLATPLPGPSGGAQQAPGQATERTGGR